MSLSITGRTPVQQGSTATLPFGIDLIRPVQASELHQRPTSTAMRLVHTEEVTGSIPVSPTQKTASHRPCFRDRAVDPLAWCPISGAVWERILPGSDGRAASRVSRTGTIERGASRARSRSEAAHRSCKAGVSSARMASLTWLYTPRKPDTSCPIRSDLRTSAMRSSSIHVWWPCRSPCGVRPVSTGSHDANTRSAAGSCPDPSQRLPCAR